MKKFGRNESKNTLELFYLFLIATSLYFVYHNSNKQKKNKKMNYFFSFLILFLG